MARRPSDFSQADVTRIIKGAVAAGVALDKIAGVRVAKDGVTLLFGERRSAPIEADNEWDEVLK